MVEIKEGEYIRTTDGRIDKVINVNYYIPAYIETRNGIVDKDVIIKQSEHIEDLLEIEDILLILLPRTNKKILYVFDKYAKEGFFYKDIKEKKIKILEILTKEEFNKKSYKLEKEWSDVRR